MHYFSLYTNSKLEMAFLSQYYINTFVQYYFLDRIDRLIQCDVKQDQNLIIARGNLRGTFSYYIFVPHFVLQKSIIGSLPLKWEKRTFPPSYVLFGGTVLTSYVLFGGTFPPCYVLFGGTVPLNSFSPYFKFWVIFSHSILPCSSKN